MTRRPLLPTAGSDAPPTPSGPDDPELVDPPRRQRPLWLRILRGMFFAGLFLCITVVGLMFYFTLDDALLADDDIRLEIGPAIPDEQNGIAALRDACNLLAQVEWYQANHRTWREIVEKHMTVAEPQTEEANGLFDRLGVDPTTLEGPLAELHRELTAEPPRIPDNWREFLRASEDVLAHIDEALEREQFQARPEALLYEHGNWPPREWVDYLLLRATVELQSGQPRDAIPHARRLLAISDRLLRTPGGTLHELQVRTIQVLSLMAVPLIARSSAVTDEDLKALLQLLDEFERVPPDMESLMAHDYHCLLKFVRDLPPAGPFDPGARWFIRLWHKPARSQNLLAEKYRSFKESLLQGQLEVPESGIDGSHGAEVYAAIDGTWLVRQHYGGLTKIYPRIAQRARSLPVHYLSLRLVIAIRMHDLDQDSPPRTLADLAPHYISEETLVEGQRFSFGWDPETRRIGAADMPEGMEELIVRVDVIEPMED